MKYNIAMAKLFLVFILVLDISATISAMNQHTNFWQTPESAADFEGNPIASAALREGLPLAAGLVLTWTALILLLYHYQNPFRFQVFYGIFFWHFFSWLTWIFPTTLGAGLWTAASGNFLAFTAITVTAGLAIGALTQNKATNEFLDKTALSFRG